jgi:hypothetical protein
MIELIFAIVVIAIALLSVPLMIETNNRALERSLAQEAVFLASSVLSVATTEAWDTMSIVDTGESDVYVASKILDVNDADSGSSYARATINGEISNIRIGGLREDKHRQFFDYNSSKAASEQPKPVGDADFDPTIDDSVASIAGYKSAYGVSGRRVYVDDATDVFTTPAAGLAVSNLKMTEISISDDDGEVAKLRAYTANIGEADYAKRIF